MFGFIMRSSSTVLRCTTHIHQLYVWICLVLIKRVESGDQIPIRTDHHLYIVSSLFALHNRCLRIYRQAASTPQILMPNNGTHTTHTHTIAQADTILNTIQKTENRLFDSHTVRCLCPYICFVAWARAGVLR